MSDQQRKVFWGFGLAIIAIKAVFLFGYGPVISPDSAGYTSYADMILNETAWMHSVDLTNYWYPKTAFRSIGYPAIIAFTKMLSPDYFGWILVLAQMVLSLFISYMLFKLALDMSNRFGLALFVAFAHAMGHGLLLDQSVLTDSLNANLILLALIIVGRGIVGRIDPKAGQLILAGLLIAIAFLIRESGNQLQILYWPFVIWWLVSISQSWGRRIVLFLCFIAPMVIFTQGYKTWNDYRTGERFITTAGQTTMFFPAVDMQSRGVNAFENDPYLKDKPAYFQPMDQRTDLQHVGTINHHLVKTYGWNALDISRYGFKKFVDYWLEYPVDMLVVTFSNIREKQAFNAFMPFEAMMSIDFWATGTKPFQKKRDLFEKVKQDNRYDLLAAYIGRNIARVISIVLTVCLIFGVPYFTIRHFIAQKFRVSEIRPDCMLIFMFWLVYLGYTFAFAMVHLEQRYLMPVIPLGTLAAMMILTGPFDRIRTKLGGLRNRGSR
ncbi:hypothetical protein RYZ26_14605 [Terasakiella sp. A23]|uniref:hypothetical protein n=1 Tax=Terasakiella sp. FCG-A23 TaxID=3080561 RepID=UPI0029529E8F|nr:hypothetical protein [Terasakiella sp. A23]MDV7340834.1 hypothetical protein [Terasakiella sp. A23]